MARNFPSSAAVYIDIGDIASPGPEYLSTVAWTALGFARVASTTTDDRCIWGKWGQNQNARQAHIRIDGGGGTPPRNIHVGHNNVDTRITSDTVIQLDTWYLFAVSCDGSANLQLWCYLMDGSSLLTTTPNTGTTNGDRTTLTATVGFGRTDSGNDEMDGDIAHVAYIERELATQDVLDYLRNPAKVVAQEIGRSGVGYYLPLGLGSPEPDFSGNGRNGTITGSPGLADNPPTAPWYGGDIDYGIFTAPGGVTENVAAGITATGLLANAALNAVTKQYAGTVAASGLVVAPLTALTKQYVAAVAASGLLANAALDPVTKLYTGAIGASGLVVGTLDDLTKQYVAAVTADGDITDATLDLLKRVVAAITASGLVGGAALDAVTKQIVGVVTATGLIAGGLSGVTKQYTAAITADGDITDAVLDIVGVIEELVAAITASGTVGGAALEDVTKQYSAAVDATGTLVGTLDGLTKLYVGAIVASGEITIPTTLDVSKFLNAAIDATGDITGDLNDLTKQFVAAIVASGDVDAALDGINKALIAAVAATGALSDAQLEDVTKQLSAAVAADGDITTAVLSIQGVASEILSTLSLLGAGRG